MKKLEGRHALVTGAGRGIGRAIAAGLAEEGGRVTLVARHREPLEELATEIQGNGGHATVAAADVSTAEGVASIASPREWPPVDILVNAAGVFGPMQLIAESDAGEWLATVRTNLFSAYLTCRRYVPAMVAQGWGRVLNVTSAASLHTPGPLNSAYATSKVAINQFTRHVAAEVQGTGVTANVFHPGDVRTQMFEDVRAGVEQAGALAAGNYDPWVQWVERTGGDPPRKAVDLVLRVATDGRGTPNGEFLWIDEPLQPAIPSWTTEGEAPSYV